MPAAGGGGGAGGVVRSLAKSDGAWCGREGVCGREARMPLHRREPPRCGGAERCKLPASCFGSDWWEPRVRTGGRWIERGFRGLPLGERRAAHGVAARGNTFPRPELTLPGSLPLLVDLLLNLPDQFGWRHFQALAQSEDRIDRRHSKTPFHQGNITTLQAGNFSELFLGHGRIRPAPGDHPTHKLFHVDVIPFFQEQESYRDDLFISSYYSTSV